MNQFSGNTTRIELVAEFSGQTEEQPTNIIHFWNTMMTFQDSAKLSLFALFLVSCPSDDKVSEEQVRVIVEDASFNEEDYIQVCYNPSSILHLSEICNQWCFENDFEGVAHCRYLSEEICQQEDLELEIRQTCGLLGLR